MKRAMFKVVVISLALFLITANLWGAGRRDDERAGQVLFWTTHGPPDITYITAIVDAFNATNPAIPVVMQQVPGAETDATALMIAVRGGTGPDVFMLDRFTIAQRASDGFLEDITDVLRRRDPQIHTRYVGYAWEEVVWRNRIYGLPFDTDARALFFNKRMLREAGIDPAELDPSRGPVTFARLREIARAVDTAGADGNFIRAGLIPTLSQGWHYSWGFAAGGEFADLAAGRVTPTHPGVVRGFQFLYDWHRDMGAAQVQTFISSFWPPGTPPQAHPFHTENLAMVVQGNWFIGHIARYAPHLEYGITYLPVPNAGDRPGTWSGGWSLVVPTDARNKEAAVDFMLFAAGRPGQAIFAQMPAMPTYAALLNDPAVRARKPEIFLRSLEFSRSRPPIPVAALYWDALSTAQNLVIQNQQLPLAALQAVEQQVQPQLQRFLPLR